VTEELGIDSRKARLFFLFFITSRPTLGPIPCNRYRWWNGRVVKLNTHLHLLPRLRKLELYLHTHILLNDVAFRYLSPGISLPYICHFVNCLFSWKLINSVVTVSKISTAGSCICDTRLGYLRLKITSLMASTESFVKSEKIIYWIHYLCLRNTLSTSHKQSQCSADMIPVPGENLSICRWNWESYCHLHRWK
jgi:hypothetical protein